MAIAVTIQALGEGLAEQAASLLGFLDRLVQFHQFRSYIRELGAQGGRLNGAAVTLEVGDTRRQLVQDISERKAGDEGQGGAGLGLLHPIGATGDGGLTSVDDLLNPVASRHGDRFCPIGHNGRPPPHLQFVTSRV
jgi:hypothetical protein